MSYTQMSMSAQYNDNRMRKIRKGSWGGSSSMNFAINGSRFCFVHCLSPRSSSRVDPPGSEGAFQNAPSDPGERRIEGQGERSTVVRYISPLLWEWGRRESSEDHMHRSSSCTIVPPLPEEGDPLSMTKGKKTQTAHFL